MYLVAMDSNGTLRTIENDGKWRTIVWDGEWPVLTNAAIVPEDAVIMAEMLPPDTIDSYVAGRYLLPIVAIDNHGEFDTRD